jgi:hypothetical protein
VETHTLIGHSKVAKIITPHGDSWCHRKATQRHGLRKKEAQVKTKIEVLKQMHLNEWTTEMENTGIF